MIDDLLKSFLKNPACITFDGSTTEDIEKINILLQSQNFAIIPQQYQAFLQLTNGFICDGVELMGTLPHRREEKQYIFPDLSQINKPYANYEYFTHKLILGRSSESLIIYDSLNNYYAIADRVNLFSRMEVNNVEELLIHIRKICGIKA